MENEIIKFNVINKLPQAADLEMVGIMINRIHDIVKNQCIEGIHYGIIPGTDKKTLWKAGAELIQMNFTIRPTWEIKVNKFEGSDFHREFEIICRLYKDFNNENEFESMLIGEGHGSCSTYESKYRYRYRPSNQKVPDSYWRYFKLKEYNKAQGELPFQTKAMKSGGEWRIAFREENPDVADLWNTCMKIGKKRAHVDAILNLFAASDIFETDPEKLKKVMPKDENGDNESDASFKDLEPEPAEPIGPDDNILIIPYDKLDNYGAYIDRLELCLEKNNGLLLAKKLMNDYSSEIILMDDESRNKIKAAYQKVREKFDPKVKK